MSQSANSNKFVENILPILFVIGIAVWILHGCSEQRESRDYEMKGRGMLEAKGFYGELPPGAGEDYYHMQYYDSYKHEDYSNFFRKIKMYQAGREYLRQRGLSESDLRKVPKWDIYDAFESADVGAAFDKLAKQYN